MKDLMAQLITPQVQMIGKLMLAFIVLLYVLQIVWVIRDAYLRGSYPWLWGIVSIFPIIGLIAYLVLRPTMYSADRQEQDLEIALRERQLEAFGVCPQCGGNIEKDFVVCPRCDTQVRNVCPTCHKPLEPDYNVCPYCRTRVSGR